MEDLSIKIKIADREYPMKVKLADEERVRMAGKLINEKIKSYREQFGIDDKQDLSAMVAFDCLFDKMAAYENYQLIDQTVFEKVNQLNHLVSQSILQSFTLRPSEPRRQLRGICNPNFFMLTIVIVIVVSILATILLSSSI